MKELSRLQAIKLLSAQKVYDAMPDEDLYLGDGKYLTIYDILASLDVTKEEINFVTKLRMKELDLLK